jgi:serine/threonine protein kinase
MTDLNKLGKYEIRGELGQGAMGIVYDGFDPMIGRRVALKTVRRDQLERAEAEEILARFKREAQAAGRLNHPNIVSIYEYGEDNGTAFIAMEFVEGRELKDYFDGSERFPMAEIVRIMGQLLEALDFSHKNGVVHRDIKPANIILLKDGTVKVADFGIARVESSNLTQAGSVLGTPSYMSPEQFMGQTVDGRSDLFSAGVILYQFLTGEKPFTGALTTIMHKVLKEQPAAPSELNVQVPRPFDALIGKALAKRPDERFQNGREFAIALKMAAAGQAVPGDSDATLVNDGEATLVNDAEQTLAMPKGPAAPPRRPRPSPRPPLRRPSNLRRPWPGRSAAASPLSAWAPPPMSSWAEWAPRPRLARRSLRPHPPAASPGGARRPEHHGHQRPRPGRPLRPALPGRQGPAQRRPARGCPAPARREGPRPVRRQASLSQATTSLVNDKLLPAAATSSRPCSRNSRRSWARTA